MLPSRHINRILPRAVVVLIACVVVTGCATQPVSGAADVPGFFMGLLHGFCLFFSLVGSLFTDVRIYAFPNSGFFYDLGFFFGASAFLGGGGAGANKCRPR